MNEWMLSKHLLKEDLSAGCQAEASLIVSDGGGKKGQADLRLPVPGSGVQYSSSQLHLSRPLFNLPLGSTPIYYHETQRKKT